MARAQTHKIPRPRGRPGPEASTDVRESILNAAERRFATDGFSATAVRRIAEDVGVNTAMVHYYFGSKQRLLESVMDRVFEPLADSLKALQDKNQVGIGDVTGLLLKLAAEHPFLPPLIAREVFLPGGEMQQQFLKHFAPRLGGRIPGIVRREQEAGRLRAGLDPRITSILILSLCLFPFIARPAAQGVFGMAFDKAGIRKLSEHITGLLERGLHP